MMNHSKKTALNTFLAFGLTLLSSLAWAEPVNSAAVNETVGHVEKAIAEIAKSDFNTAQVHLKAARTSADAIGSDNPTVKQANAEVIQGQILAKKGEIKPATEELNKAIALYKGL